MSDPIPYITPSQYRVRRLEGDDVTHIVAPAIVAWFLVVALVANWMAGG